MRDIKISIYTTSVINMHAGLYNLKRAEDVGEG